MKEAIAESTLSQAVDAYRSYDAATELTDLKKGRLDIIAPTAWTKNPACRSMVLNTCGITCFIRKAFEKFDGKSVRQADVDAWIGYLDELTDAKWFGSLSTYNATLADNGVSIDVPFDADSLKSTGMFQSVVTFTVQWWVLPNQ